jgi:hypothetical protein
MVLTEDSNGTYAAGYSETLVTVHRTAGTRHGFWNFNVVHNSISDMLIALLTLFDCI